MSTDNLYDKLLIDLVMENGEIHDGRDAQGNYVFDHALATHILGGGFGWTKNDNPCGWDTSGASIFEDAQWQEPGDSFNEGTHVTGMMVEGLACRCGKMAGVSMRWQADVSTTIHTVMRRLAESGALDLKKVNR